jgi:hypothetical protein
MRVNTSKMPGSSRVWIYQADRKLKASEVEEAARVMKDFTESWQSHGKPVYASSEVFEEFFLILFADEEASGVSGCSIDGSVRLVQDLGAKFGIDFFNRLNLACNTVDGIRIYPNHELLKAIENGEISAHTQVFDNTVEDKAEFEKSWKRTLENSWAAQTIS